MKSASQILTTTSDGSEVEKRPRYQSVAMMLMSHMVFYTGGEGYQNSYVRKVLSI